MRSAPSSYTIAASARHDEPRGRGKRRRPAVPMAKERHLARDVLVRQGAARVLAALHHDLNLARVVADEPGDGAMLRRRSPPRP
jgi:hypothetical protein